MAALPENSAMVHVGPPLLAREPRLGSPKVPTQLLSVLGQRRLCPPSVMTPKQLPPLLLATMVFLRVGVPVLTKMPPPALPALLPLKVLLLTVSVPPLASVSPLSVTDCPMLLTCITRTALLPLMVMLCPLPSMVRPSLMAGRVGLTTIVPLTLKVMVSVPLPAAQSVEPDWLLLLALVMASRSVQLPSLAGAPSARLVTTIRVLGAALALGLHPAPSATSSARPRTASPQAMRATMHHE